MKSPREKLTYANVMATLAFVLALTGGATAVAVSTKLKKNSVKTKAIRDGAITGEKLASVRIETLSSPTAPTLHCRPGEQMLSGGFSSINVQTSQPTSDGNGWTGSSQGGGGGTLSIVCLGARPGR